MLRAAIARHLAQFRGIRCRPEQVVVFSSAQQALCALAVLLLEPGDSVWIEDPGYPGARAPHARLAYLTPGHQYPTGVALSLERRIELLDWAAREQAWLVEDDYDGEFRYAGQPLTTLRSLDPQARVLYLGTLSKATFVSLRLAYAVVPEEIVEPLASLRTQLDGFTPALPQLTMGQFMEEGHFSAHLRRMRGAYAAKRDQLLEGLAPLAARGWSWSANPAGLHLLVRHPSGQLVRSVAAACPLDLALLGAYRLRRSREDGLFLRFGGLRPGDVSSGVATLAAAARKADARLS